MTLLTAGSHVLCGSVGESGKVHYEFARDIHGEEVGNVEIAIVLYWHKLAGRGRPTRILHSIAIAASLEGEPLQEESTVDIDHDIVNEGVPEEEPSLPYPLPL